MSVKSTKDKFISKSHIKHNFRYNYDNFIYEGSNIKGIIICPIHGPFNQEPKSHLWGCGCPDCGNMNKSKKLIKGKNQFILESKKSSLR
jgi:hypothetical protein